MRGSFFAVAAAALCSLSSCDSEVTLRLLSRSAGDSGGASASAGAGSGGTAAASDGGGGSGAGGGSSGTSGALGEADAGMGASAGDGGDTPPKCDQILSSAEVCNGADDNCDGAIDEGCAFTIKWTDQPEGPGLGKPGARATEFGQPCPRGSLLTGISVGMGTRLDQLKDVCQQFELTLDPSTQAPTSVSFTSAKPLKASVTPDSSKETDTFTDLFCPAGLFVSSLDGTTTVADPQYTQRVQVSCSPLIVANGLLSFDTSKTQVLKAVTCTGCSSTPTLDFNGPVPAGQVASGVFGRDGAWVDLFGLSTTIARVQPL